MIQPSDQDTSKSTNIRPINVEKYKYQTNERRMMQTSDQETSNDTNIKLINVE